MPYVRPHLLSSRYGVWVASAALALGAVVAEACDGDEFADNRADAGRAGPPLNAAVRECAGASRSSGANLDLNSPQNVQAGPLILYLAGQYADAPRSEFAPARLRGYLRDEAPPVVRRGIREGSLYGGVKLLLVIAGSRPVTLEIPQAERAHASLLYAARRGHSPAEQRLGLAQLSDGRAAVRFEPCRRGGGRSRSSPAGW
jgi:hypothetical protein